jgi:ribonuclease HI
MYSLISDRRSIDIDGHSGTRGQYLVKYELDVGASIEAGGIDGLSKYYPDIVCRIADDRNLRAAWDYLAACGGEAPGPDGWRYGDFRGRQVWDLLRSLRKLITTGNYSPGPDREIEYPKGPGRGTRTLRLQNILDRVLARAVVQIVQPLLDPTFGPLSFGGRPRRGRWDALIQAELAVRKSPGAVLIAEDARDAFDNVPLGRLLDIVSSRFHNSQLVALVSSVIGNSSNMGLRQGSPLSPLLLNLYLDHFLDKPWQRQQPDAPLLRFVDDLLIICPQESDPTQVYNSLRQVLCPTGMALKGDATSSSHRIDHGERFFWLGYQIASKDGKLEFRSPPDESENGWSNGLRDAFGRAHTKSNPPLRANEIVLSFIDNLAPCVPTLDSGLVYQQMKAVAGELSFEEISGREIFAERLKKAHRRWQRRRASVLGGDGALPRRRKKGRHSRFGRQPRGQYDVFCDGACLGNQAGGAAYIVLSRSGGFLRKRRWRSDCTTNNRAELFAVIASLSGIAAGSTIRVHSDSRYLVQGIDDGLARWKANGWRRGRSGQTGRLKNEDLWRELDELLQQHRVQVVWVPAHAGDRWNERCDQLARDAACLIGTNCHAALFHDL